MLPFSTTHPWNKAWITTWLVSWLWTTPKWWQLPLYFFIADDMFLLCMWLMKSCLSCYMDLNLSLLLPNVPCLSSCRESIWHSLAPILMSPHDYAAGSWDCVLYLPSHSVFIYLMRAHYPNLQSSKVDREGADHFVTLGILRDYLVLTATDRVSGNVNAQEGKQQRMYLTTTLLLLIKWIGRRTLLDFMWDLDCVSC